MVDYLHIIRNTNFTQHVNYLTSPDYLVIDHKVFRGRGLAKLWYMLKPLVAIIIFVALFTYVMNFNVGEFELTIAFIVLALALFIIFGGSDDGDFDVNLIFSETGLTMLVNSQNGRTNMIKHYPTFASVSGEMAWSQFKSYSIVHHEKRGTVSIRLWLIDEPDSCSYDELKLKERRNVAVEFFLNPIDNRYIKLGDCKITELKAGVKFLQEHLPLYSEFKVSD
ncbi:MAG: hypothetical protein ACI376_01875 [Candidatus Bruticola sp.]